MYVDEINLKGGIMALIRPCYRELLHNHRSQYECSDAKNSGLKDEIQTWVWFCLSDFA